MCNGSKRAVLACDSLAMIDHGIKVECNKMFRGLHGSALMHAGISDLSKGVTDEWITGEWIENTVPEHMILGIHQDKLKIMARSIGMHYRGIEAEKITVTDSFVGNTTSYLLIYPKGEKLALFRLLGDVNLAAEEEKVAVIGVTKVFHIVYRLLVGETWDVETDVEDGLLTARALMEDVAKVTSLVGPPFRFYIMNHDGTIEEK